MLQFTIRDVLWLTVVVALAVGWQLNRAHTEDEMVALQRGKIALQNERDTLFALLQTAANKEERARQEAQTFESLALYYKDARSTPSNR